MGDETRNNIYIHESAKERCPLFLTLDYYGGGGMDWIFGGGGDQDDDDYRRDVFNNESCETYWFSGCFSRALLYANASMLVQLFLYIF